jgi:hypothetical protein
MKSRLRGQDQRSRIGITQWECGTPTSAPSRSHRMPNAHAAALLAKQRRHRRGRSTRGPVADHDRRRRRRLGADSALPIVRMRALSTCRPLLADGWFGHRAAARSAICPPPAIEISSPRSAPAPRLEAEAAGASSSRFVAVAGRPFQASRGRRPRPLHPFGCGSRQATLARCGQVLLSAPALAAKRIQLAIRSALPAQSGTGARGLRKPGPATQDSVALSI